MNNIDGTTDCNFNIGHATLSCLNSKNSTNLGHTSFTSINDPNSCMKYFNPNQQPGAFGSCLNNSN